MKKIISLIMMMGISLMVGCKSYTCKFPTEINSVAHGCKNSAEIKIEAHGHSLKMQDDCLVTEVPAEKNFGGMWCWYDPTWKMYVGGICGGDWIKIGCNPNNRADIHSPSLEHEMGHYWLMTCIGDFTHNPKYDNDFNNWRGSREATGSTVESSGWFLSLDTAKDSVKIKHDKSEYGKPFSVNYIDEFGQKIHVDFIKLDK